MALVSLAATLLAAGVTLIELHGADGQRFLLNPAEISTVRETSAQDLQRHFAAGAHCVIVTTNGKFLAVRETCNQVEKAVRP